MKDYRVSYLAVLFFIINSLAVVIAAESSADTTSVLFIGNSYTYVNDLPKLFKDLSTSGGKFVYTDQSDPGGFTLAFHMTYQPTLNLIHERRWSYIVLQEQSQSPTIDYLRYYRMYPAARALDSMIHVNGSRTVFYETWGRKYGGQQCIDSMCSPVFRDFFHMQDSLRSAYTEISSMLGSILASVGEGWRRARMLDTLQELFDADLSHPSLKGSYLAACVFYATLFHESPVGLSFTSGLSQQDAYFLQSCAAYLIIGIQDPAEEANNFSLSQNYPNPFNPNTIISYQLAVNTSVKLDVYDLNGKLVTNLINQKQTAGIHRITFDGSNLASGVYFYSLHAGSFSDSRKMLLIK